METLNRDEVATRVRELLAETLHRDSGEINLDDRLEDLGVASIDLITLVFELEDAFGRTLEDEDIAGLTTVGSVVDFLVDGGAGVFLGTGVGGLCSCLESNRFVVLDQPRRALQELEGTEAVLAELAIPRAFNPFSVAMTMPNASAAALSIKLGLCGPCRTFTGACASGTVALGQAFRALRQGECDLALTGGVEFLGDPFGGPFRGFDAVGALAAGSLPPDQLNRPLYRAR